MSNNPEQYSREWIAERVQDFLNAGGKIDVKPPCAFSCDLEPESKTRRRLEKIKIFGDDDYS